MSKLITDGKIRSQVQVSVRQRLSPTLKSIGKSDALDVDGGPVALRDDLVSDASRRKDGRQVVEGATEVVAHLVDVVPLIARCGDGHVVGVQLELVKLPLEDEQRSWKLIIKKLVRIDKSIRP
jgi:hypothetical protein